MIGYTQGGYTIRFREYHIRFWKYGFEYGNRFGGRVVWWPWKGLLK